MAVLNRTLTEEQRAQMAADDYFEVTSSTGRRWRIHTTGQTGNVELLNDAGQPSAVFCAHPLRVPDPAAWLTQARTIMSDEAGFLLVAIPQMRYDDYAEARPLPVFPRPRLYGTAVVPQPPCYTLTAGQVHIHPSCRCR